jgi:hypothetical protein
MTDRHHDDPHSPDRNGETAAEAAAAILRENPDATAVVRVNPHWQVCAKDPQAGGTYRAFRGGEYLRVPLRTASDWFAWGSVWPVPQAEVEARGIEV